MLRNLDGVKLPMKAIAVHILCIQNQVYAKLPAKTLVSRFVNSLQTYRYSHKNDVSGKPWSIQWTIMALVFLRIIKLLRVV